jgi:hypothetical protein
MRELGKAEHIADSLCSARTVLVVPPAEIRSARSSSSSFPQKGGIGGKLPGGMVGSLLIG